ncbi:MAG: dihydroxy-acid dehydratase, partial [Asticcacaulis sp.]|nr:dihydroxy-acid dehydratase [Asticcacaulis sp.]
GRMSGASGKVAAVIHLTPEAVDGGPIAKLRTGDLLRVDCEKGTIDYLGDAAEFAQRQNAQRPAEADGVGRELFAHLRRAVGPADAGGAVFW